MASEGGSGMLKLEGSNSTNNQVVNPAVIQSDASAVPNTVKLNGSNYPLWSKVLEMHIAGRGRKGFVTGSIKEPAEASAEYEALRQEGRPVGVYYADLKSVWQELDQRRPIKMVCVVDRVYAFLAGLDDVFDKVRSDILRTQPLPSVEEVFSVVRREAQRHATMMGESNNQGGLPSMAMISRPAGPHRASNFSNQSLNSQPFNRENKDDLKSGSSGGRASLAAATPTVQKAVPSPSDSGQNLLTRAQGASSSDTGTMGHVLLASEKQHHTGWILDSGATDHMTYDKNMFQYMTTSHRKNISTANGTLAPVCGAGTVHLTPSLPLHHCLLVPSLSHHLLSIPQSDVGMVFRNFSQMLRTQYFSVIKVLRSDNGGEYINRELSEFLGDQGILHETTCPYTPQQNGVAERKNHHILETARALLLGASVPKVFWPEAVTYAVYVINRMPSRVVHFQTLFQVLTQHVPVVSSHTLQPRVYGYPQGENSSDDLKWLDLEGIPVFDAVHNGAVLIHAENDKSAIVAESSMQSGPVPDESDPESDKSPTVVESSLQTVAESSMQFSPEGKVKYLIANYVSCSGLAPERKTLVDNMEATRVPTRVEEALKDQKWANAMDEEMLALQKNNTWEFDVKNVFLHGNLEEEVYMDFPPGYSAGRNTGVCRLRKSLYGLKQSPRAWFDRFTQVMKKIGYYQSHSDHTLFVKRRQEKVTALIIYVDDMIITGDDCDEISRLQRNLAAEFEMKNLGDLKYFLGVEVARSSKGIFLSQRKYVLDLLKGTGMLGCKPVNTPIVEKHHLCLDPNQKSVDKGRYQRLVGRLIYLAHTRPDIAYAVSVVSQFMHSPSEDHMAAVMRILAYLKSAPGKEVLYRKHGHLRIEGFTDADWAGSIGDRRSTSGYFTFVGGNLVTWRSKKQKVVSRSSAEAEFRGMAHGICELLWLRKLLARLGFKPKETMRLYCDNKSARDIADNPVQHDRTKHVEVDRHFIKEKLERKIVSIPFVSSDEQLADVLTHAVCSREFDDSLVNISSLQHYSIVSCIHPRQASTNNSSCRHMLTGIASQQLINKYRVTRFLDVGLILSIIYTERIFIIGLCFPNSFNDKDKIKGKMNSTRIDFLM
ncbi:hypothetical protein D8674_007784 [Pyrus ussuriensis x Pyrus communis]|uniref:Integrase catalytic domain-containing protein n=1 Tax=Pyrus ussuriensis x Pyrus communis TaxID=2448454 RepID=A0A5N5HQZ6_9ROSA|nr:hypothetical protein D8674_007784 [Pyrus ussuriensis x Pyrus communis]